MYVYNFFSQVILSERLGWEIRKTLSENSSYFKWGVTFHRLVILGPTQNYSTILSFINFS